MKKLLIACAASLMLTGAAVSAEELPYLRELPQYNYYSTTLLTEESYPEVRITTEYPSIMLSDYYDGDHLFLCFAGPEGALPEHFDNDEAGYIDEEKQIQYYYQVAESASFEEFINEAAEDDYILLDGSDGTAARIDPDKNAAYGMLKTTEFGKSAKLYIKIVLDSLSSKMPLETRVDALTKAILPEIERVSGAMRYEPFDPYWSAGTFGGVKMLDYDFQSLITVDFPSMELTAGDGSTLTGTIIPTRLRGDDFAGIIYFGKGLYAELDIEYDTYSYAQHQLEENADDVFTHTYDSGNEWVVYISNRDSENRPFGWYATHFVDYESEYSGQYGLSIHISSTNGIRWADENDIFTDLEKFDSFVFGNPADDPYTPSGNSEAAESADEGAEPAGDDGAQAEPAEDAGSEAAAWICPDCGQENTGNFCTNCGSPKPEENGAWTCPECGQEGNEGNFCSNCGAAKP